MAEYLLLFLPVDKEVKTFEPARMWFRRKCGFYICKFLLRFLISLPYIYIYIFSFLCSFENGLSFKFGQTLVAYGAT